MTASATRSETLWDELTAVLGGRLECPDGSPRGLWRRAVVEPLSDFLSRPGKAFRGNLVRSAWRLAGREDEPPAALPLIVELVHAGSLIVDDVQDDASHRRGAPAVHCRHGVPIALNTGCSLFFVAMQLLREAGLSPARELELHRQMVDAMTTCHHGQALDLKANTWEVRRTDAPRVVDSIARGKTGALMRLAASLGVRGAGGAPMLVAAVEEFGERLGVGLQMWNDLADLSIRSGCARNHEDLRSGRLTWPWAWLSQQCDDAAYSEFQREARAVVDDRQCPESLARRLSGAVGAAGRSAVRETLGEALQDLESVVGPGSVIDDLADEIERLERCHAG